MRLILAVWLVCLTHDCPNRVPIMETYKLESSYVRKG